MSPAIFSLLDTLGSDNILLNALRSNDGSINDEGTLTASGSAGKICEPPKSGAASAGAEGSAAGATGTLGPAEVPTGTAGGSPATPSSASMTGSLTTGGRADPEGAGAIKGGASSDAATGGTSGTALAGGVEEDDADAPLHTDGADAFDGAAVDAFGVPLALALDFALDLP